MYMTIHLNFCFIIIVSTMYDKMMVFIFVIEIETNNTNTTYGDG